MSDEYFETEVLPKVLANEVTARLFLKGMIDKGVKFSLPIESLTHAECQEAGLMIYTSLKYGKHPDVTEVKGEQ